MCFSKKNVPGTAAEALRSQPVVQVKVKVKSSFFLQFNISCFLSAKQGGKQGANKSRGVRLK